MLQTKEKPDYNSRGKRIQVGTQELNDQDNQKKLAAREMMAASAAGTHNIVPALSGVGDGAGAETPSSATVAPKFDKVTSTTTKMVKTLATLKLSISFVRSFFFSVC